MPRRALRGAALAFLLTWAPAFAPAAHAGDASATPGSKADPTQVAMRELASRVGELDGMLRASRPLDPAQRARVATLLAQIEELTSRLAELPAGEHPRLRELSRLRSDVRRARDAVTSEPPDYYFAGAISGACVYCHASL